jgi:hypothetical protein
MATLNDEPRNARADRRNSSSRRGIALVSALALFASTTVPLGHSHWAHGEFGEHAVHGAHENDLSCESSADARLVSLAEVPCTCPVDGIESAAALARFLPWIDSGPCVPHSAPLSVSSAALPKVELGCVLCGASRAGPDSALLLPRAVGTGTIDSIDRGPSTLESQSFPTPPTDLSSGAPRAPPCVAAAPESLSKHPRLV